MKKIISVLSCALTLTFAVSSCSWFKLDNMDGWDASVEGQIVDAATNQPIQFEQGLSTITVVQKEKKSEANQAWNVKNNGSYKNALVFSGKYVMDTKTSNFIAEAQDFELTKGENKVTFKATPYVRIENVDFKMENGKIKAVCKVSSPVAQANNIGDVRLCIAPDRFVRFSNNNAANDPGSIFKDAKVDGSSEIVLYIDPALPANAAEFQYDMPHYVRIGAVAAHYFVKPEWDETLDFDWDAYVADGYPENYWDYMNVVKHHPAEYTSDGSINPNMAYNYSPVYKLDLKTGTFNEVTDW
jgi:hypothetical protein